MYNNIFMGFYIMWMENKNKKNLEEILLYNLKKNSTFL
jgi:hypothetical protein